MRAATKPREGAVAQLFLLGGMSAGCATLTRGYYRDALCRGIARAVRPYVREFRVIRFVGASDFYIFCFATKKQLPLWNKCTIDGDSRKIDCTVRDYAQ